MALSMVAQELRKPRSSGQGTGPAIYLPREVITVSGSNQMYLSSDFQDLTKCICSVRNADLFYYLRWPEITTHATLLGTSQALPHCRAPPGHCFPWFPGPLSYLDSVSLCLPQTQNTRLSLASARLEMKKVPSLDTGRQLPTYLA